MKRTGMSPGQVGWSLVLVVACGLGLCLALGFGVLALAAFGDSRLRCPGFSCREALIGGAFFVVVALVGLGVAGVALSWLAASRRR